MPRKPDAFERMAEKEYAKWLKQRPGTSGWITIPIALLRRHHAKIERMVRMQQSSWGEQTNEMMVLQHVLTKMKAMRR